LNTELEVLTGIFYIHKLDHRNNSPDKSQWSITPDEETNCFTGAITAKCTKSSCCWGLHFDNTKKVMYVGVTAKSNPEERELFIAKFVDSNENSKWHGYPADPCNQKQQDIPPEFILNDWLAKKYLRPQIVRKIGKGQKCKL